MGNSIFKYCYDQCAIDLPLVPIVTTIQRLRPDIRDHYCRYIIEILYEAWYSLLFEHLKKEEDWKMYSRENNSDHFKSFCETPTQYYDLLSYQVITTCFAIENEQQEQHQKIETEVIDIPVLQHYVYPTIEKEKRVETLIETLRTCKATTLFPNINTPAFQKAYQHFLQSFHDFLTWNSLIKALLPSSGNKHLGGAMNSIKTIKTPEFFVLQIPNLQGYTLFHLICEEGSIELTQYTLKMIQHFEPRNVYAPPSWNPRYLNQYLVNNVKLDQWTDVEICIQWGADYKYVSPTKKNILHYAVSSGAYERIPFFLDKGISIHAEEGGWSALYWALKPLKSVSDEAVLQTVKILIDAGATWDELFITKVMPNGETVICQHPWKLIVKSENILLIQWVEMQMPDWITWVDHQGQNALHWTAEIGNVELFIYFLNAGLSPNLKDQQMRDAYDCAVDEEMKMKLRNVINTPVVVELEITNCNSEDLQSLIVSAKQSNDPSLHFSIARLYESQKMIRESLGYYKMASSQGHRLANEALSRILQYENNELKRLSVISDWKHSGWIEDFIGEEEELHNELVEITTIHPVFSAYQQITSSLHNFPVLDESYEVVTGLKRVISWVVWSEDIQAQKTISKKTINEMKSSFRKIYKKAKKLYSQPADDLLLKTSLGKQLFDYYNTHTQKKTSMLLSDHKINPLSLYAIVLPYLLKTCEDLYLLLLPHSTKKYHAIWRPVTQGLRALVTHYNDMLTKRFESRSFTWPDPKPIMISAETGYAYLQSSYVSKLITKRLKSDTRAGTHLMVILNGCHFKKLLHVSVTDGPGTEYAVDALHKLIALQGSPPSTLIKVQYGSNQAIYQVSKTVQGIDLEFVLEHHPEDLSVLDSFNYSAMFMMSLLVMPRDGKPDNFILQYLPDKFDASTFEKVQLISIDNDRAFGMPLLRDRFGSIRSGVQNVLFFFPHARNEVDDQFRSHFLRLDPALICIRWLGCLYEKNKHYEYLLESDIFTEVEFSGNPSIIGDVGLQLPIKLHSGYITQLFSKIVKLQSAMRENPSISHLQLLECCEPLLYSVYSSILSENLSVMQSFTKVWNVDLSADYLRSLSPHDINNIPMYSKSESKESIESAATHLLSAIEIEKHYSDSSKVEIFFERTLKYLPFCRTLTLWSAVGLSIHQFIAQIQSFKYVEFLHLKGKLNWTIKDILRISKTCPSLKIILEEDENQCMPLTPADWRILQEKNVRVFVKFLGIEAFSLRCSMEQLESQARDRNLYDKRWNEFLKSSFSMLNRSYTPISRKLGMSGYRNVSVSSK